jgi:hypothetical protein
MSGRVIFHGRCASHSLSWPSRAALA